MGSRATTVESLAGTGRDLRDGDRGERFITGILPAKRRLSADAGKRPECTSPPGNSPFGLARERGVCTVGALAPNCDSAAGILKHGMDASGKSADHCVARSKPGHLGVADGSRKRDRAAADTEPGVDRPWPRRTWETGCSCCAWCSSRRWGRWCCCKGGAVGMGPRVWDGWH